MTGRGYDPYLDGMIKLGPYIIPLLLIIIFYSCTRPEQRPYGDSLYVADYQTPSIINPILTIGTISSFLAEIIFDGLIRFDEDLEAKPNLASSWEVLDNGLRWVFHLRRGVLFHDGKELTAEDVRFTLRKLKDPKTRSPFSYTLQDLNRVIIKDRYTIEVILSRPNVSFINGLSVGIIPKHLLDKEDLLSTDFNRHPIGTGPFRFVTWSDREIALEANKGHFLGRPYLDRIIVKIYPNQEAAWAGMMKGETDSFPYLNTENFHIIKKVPDLETYSYLKPLYYMISFNLKIDIFKDRRVRQALNFAIDKEGIIKEVLKGEGAVSKGPIYPSSLAYDKDLSPYKYDPKRALNLLMKAGWIDHDNNHIIDKGGKGLEFTLHINDGDSLKEKAAMIIQDQLLDIGIRMMIKRFPASSLDFLFQKRFEAVFPELVAGADPDLSYKFWHSSQIEDGFNWFSYKNKEIDRLLDQGRATLDKEERKAIYHRFQEELLDDPPGIFLFWSNYLVGVHKRFKGVKITAAGPFSNIREWYVPKGEQKYK